jgi:hypothetical protein
MKLQELNLNEGQVDVNILMLIQQIVDSGITSTIHATTLAKSIMCIQQGYTFIASSFNAYFNEMFPTKELLDSLKALVKKDAQQIAASVLSVLTDRNILEVPPSYFTSVKDILVYATQSQAND